MGTYMGNDRRDDVINGSKRGDYINGKGGNDTLYGNDGNDQIYGGNGNDRLEGGNGEDRLLGEAGNDVLLGGAGVDLLNGGFGNDTLNGGDGMDSIYGYLGADDLSGGAGADYFLYTSQTESDGANGIDLIQDFNPLEDLLEFGGDLAWIDSNSAAEGLQKWEHVGSTRLDTELADGNGQLTLGYADGITTLTLYRYGSADAFMTLRFQGDYSPGQIHGVVNATSATPYDFILW